MICPASAAGRAIRADANVRELPWVMPSAPSVRGDGQHDDGGGAEGTAVPYSSVVDVLAPVNDGSHPPAIRICPFFKRVAV